MVWFQKSVAERVNFMKGIAKREFLFLGIFFGLHFLGSVPLFLVDRFISSEYRALIIYGISFLMAVMMVVVLKYFFGLFFILGRLFV